MSATLSEITDDLYRLVYPERKNYSYNGSLPSNRLKEYKTEKEKDAALRKMYTELAELRSQLIERNAGGYNSNVSEPRTPPPQTRELPPKLGNTGIEMVPFTKKGGKRLTRSRSKKQRRVKKSRRSK
jgi:hypothetical protein